MIDIDGFTFDQHVEVEYYVAAGIGHAVQRLDRIASCLEFLVQKIKDEEAAHGPLADR